MMYFYDTEVILPGCKNIILYVKNMQMSDYTSYILSTPL